MLTWLSTLLGLDGLTETAGAILLAALAAILAFISFAAKLAASWISSWWLRRAAVIRFFNDVEIWMHDAQSSFTVEEFERLADFIENAPRDFRFQIPMSGDADTKEIMKYIHWLRPEEIKAVRRYMMLDELYESTSLVLSSEGVCPVRAKAENQCARGDVQDRRFDAYCSRRGANAAAKTAQIHKSNKCQTTYTTDKTDSCEKK